MKGRTEQLWDDIESEWPKRCQTTCCSCGLVHDLKIRVDKDKRVFITGRQNKSATVKERKKLRWKIKWNP